jgi:histone H3/H4
MAKKGTTDPLFVKSKVREYIKGNGCNTSSGILDGDTLNKIIMGILDAAINRAKNNSRKTVKARDL